MLKIVTTEGNFEIESIYNNTSNITQFQVYRNNKKLFTLEPEIIYGQGKEISWKLTKEDKGKQIDVSLIKILELQLKVLLIDQGIYPG